MNLAAELHVAQLDLKHRQNKKHYQRIILFAGRKAEKLEALVAPVNNNDNSHIIYIPPGARNLSDVNPIFTKDVDSRKRFVVVASGEGSGYDFGVDPNLDPEIDLALRVSMKEERDRQATATKKDAQKAQKQENGEMQSTSQTIIMTENVSARNSETKTKAVDILIGVPLF
uniref:Uncharacterized protein n=1 Tax=Solanum lycopersicum TaxID=4081 RepID=K4BFL5_SOLLC